MWETPHLCAESPHLMEEKSTLLSLLKSGTRGWTPWTAVGITTEKSTGHETVAGYCSEGDGAGGVLGLQWHWLGFPEFWVPRVIPKAGMTPVDETRLMHRKLVPNIHRACLRDCLNVRGDLRPKNLEGRLKVIRIQRGVTFLMPNGLQTRHPI